jgi:integrase
MPRLVHKFPKYALHKKSGRARIRYGGKDYYLPGPYNSPESRKAYAEKIAELMAGVAPGADAGSPDNGERATPSLTIAELVERYWDFARVYYRRDGKPTGEHVNIKYALLPVVELFAEILVEDFGPKYLKAVRAEMIRRKWSRRYINSSVRRIRQMFRWGVSEELIDAGVAGSLAMVPGLKKGRSEAKEKALPGAVPDEHVEATLPHVSKLVGDLIRVSRLAAMRPGEALRMTAPEIDRTDPDCWLYRPTVHKTSHHDKTRVIPLDRQVQAILGPWILKAGSGRMFPITKGGVYRAIKKGCERAMVPRWAPNQLRHAAATEIREKFSLEDAQIFLGHEKADTTERYAEIRVNRGREIAKKLAESRQRVG